jgi:hypothetical protein
MNSSESIRPCIRSARPNQGVYIVRIQRWYRGSSLRLGSMTRNGSVSFNIYYDDMSRKNET